LNKLNRTSQLEETIQYLNSEWYYTIRDLQVASSVASSWNTLKLPSRLKIELQLELNLIALNSAIPTDADTSLTLASSNEVDDIEWIRCYSEEHNAYYFYNKISQLTSWDEPPDGRYVDEHDNASYYEEWSYSSQNANECTAYPEDVTCEFSSNSVIENTEYILQQVDHHLTRISTDDRILNHLYESLNSENRPDDDGSNNADILSTSSILPNFPTEIGLMPSAPPLLITSENLPPISPMGSPTSHQVSYPQAPDLVYRSPIRNSNSKPTTDTSYKYDNHTTNSLLGTNTLTVDILKTPNITSELPSPSSNPNYRGVMPSNGYSYGNSNNPIGEVTFVAKDSSIGRFSANSYTPTLSYTYNSDGLNDPSDEDSDLDDDDEDDEDDEECDEDDEDDDDEIVTVETMVDLRLLQQLMDMGFQEDLAHKALRIHKNNISSAATYLLTVNRDDRENTSTRSDLVSSSTAASTASSETNQGQSTTTKSEPSSPKKKNDIRINLFGQRPRSPNKHAKGDLIDLPLPPASVKSKGIDVQRKKKSITSKIVKKIGTGLSKVISPSEST
jgi:hypothetical protein